MEQGDYQHAIADFTESIRLDGKNPKIFYARGFAFQLKNAPDQAIADFNEVIRRDPKDYDAHDIEVSGLYWHFVDLVWMFIFPLVYLMSTKVV